MPVQAEQQAEGVRGVPKIGDGEDLKANQKAGLSGPVSLLHILGFPRHC